MSFFLPKSEEPEYADSRVGSYITGWKRTPSGENGSDSVGTDGRDRVLLLATSEGVWGSLESSHDRRVEETDLAGGLFAYRTVGMSIPGALRFEGGS